MKIKTECVPCLLKRIIFETKQSTNNKEIQTRAIQNACLILSKNYDPKESSATIATKVHKIIYDTLGDKDPYKELKNKSNEVASSLLPKINKIISNSNDSLKSAMICSIVGNIMDFGIEGSSNNPKDLEKMFYKIYKEKLGHDDFLKSKKIIRKSKKIILFLDNCGEIVFDKVLCMELKKVNPNLFLTVVARGEPILSDATIDDINKFDFTNIVDEILTTGCFAVGVDFNKIPNKLKSSLDKSDLIICKGMANYESFSETNYKPILYLLRSKCNAIASSMDVPLNKNIIKLFN